MPELGWAALRGSYRQALTSAASVVALALGLHLGQATGRTICLALAAAVGAIAGISTYLRARAMADTATSRIGSAAQGHAQVRGRASVAAEELVRSPVSGVACIWFRYRIYSKDDSRDGWRQIDSGTSHTTFEIADASGSCRVDPDDAEVVGAEQRTSYRDGDKVVEELLFGGGQIHVLGEFSTVGGASAVLSLSEDVNALLTTWKQDPAELKRRFDLDGNGEIDLEEWELARRLATRTVELQHREIRQLGELHLMRAPRDGRPFLISPLPPQRLRGRLLAWSAFHFAVALLSLGLMVWQQR
jgi:hypothetical protein